MGKRGITTSLFSCLKWHKFTVALPYNYDMKKGLCHV
uniref:Uncharacterized protein n=1 Tax=Siphoviridae sp. ctXzK3 TaxID=2827889 RepID=A0A8S5SVM0_9CAUD|nr:MAG TPA: hypothetical protein [Siphoviridae sp. ctXzK3]DAJ21081.1 MAG TPA: hypothetical protein [Siphoviridae sp. ctoD011]